MLCEARPRRFLFLHHLGFDGGLQSLGQVDVLEHDVVEHQQVANFLARDFERPAFDLLPFLDDDLGAAQGGQFLDRFGHARLDQGLKRVAGVLAKNAYDGRLRHAVQDANVNLHLLQIR